MSNNILLVVFRGNNRKFFGINKLLLESRSNNRHYYPISGVIMSPRGNSNPRGRTARGNVSLSPRCFRYFEINTLLWFLRGDNGYYCPAKNSRRTRDREKTAEGRRPEGVFSGSRYVSLSVEVCVIISPSVDKWTWLPAGTDRCRFCICNAKSWDWSGEGNTQIACKCTGATRIKKLSNFIKLKNFSVSD